MIRVQGVGRRFDDRWAVRGIDLEVAEGESIAIMGSSGGGKTTLLRMIAGLDRPTEGKIEVDGVDVVADPERARAHMGMVFQSAALFDFMNSLDNVTFAIRRHRRTSMADAVARARAAIAQVGLVDVERKMPSELSGGMRKRLGIARAIALAPRIMLYDEPTTGLDPITTYAIDQLIAKLESELRVTSLVVTHDLNSALRVADRIAFLHGGSIIFDGAPTVFVDHPHPAIAELVQTARATNFATTQ